MPLGSAWQVPFGVDENDIPIEKMIRRIDKHTAAQLATLLGEPCTHFDLFPETAGEKVAGQHGSQKGNKMGRDFTDLMSVDASLKEAGGAVRPPSAVLRASAAPAAASTPPHPRSSRAPAPFGRQSRPKAIHCASKVKRLASGTKGAAQLVRCGSHRALNVTGRLSNGVRRASESLGSRAGRGSSTTSASNMRDSDPLGTLAIPPASGGACHRVEVTAAVAAREETTEERAAREHEARARARAQATMDIQKAHPDW